MPARAIILATLIAAIVLSIGATPLGALLETPPPIDTGANAGHYGDKQLYRDISAEVRDGAPYYRAAAQLHREHHYPLKPGITVRLPTLALIAAQIGWQWLRAFAFGLLAATALAWFHALRGKASLPERLAAAALILGSAGMLAGDPAILHERWAGLFLALALALRIGRREAWPAALMAVAAALAMRELALPYALLGLAFALGERQWREALGWALLILLFAAMIAFHLHHVTAQVQPGDLASQGWTALGGPVRAIAAIVDTSPLQYLPVPVAFPLAVLPLLGWLGLGRRDARFCLALFAGYALMFALFARPDNFYWGAIVQPAWFVGLAFLPRAVAQVSDALRRGNLAGPRAAL
ncbi:MAG: hypothetical protein QM676_08920 [Novosphingobium sp.]